MPQQQQTCLVQAVTTACYQFLEEERNEEEAAGQSNGYNLSVPLPHPLPRTLENATIRDSTARGSKRRGTRASSQCFRSLWVVMINRHDVLTWEEDIVFTRSIPTSILEICC